MILHYDEKHEVFFLQCSQMFASEAPIVQAAGFTFVPDERIWFTADRFRALVVGMNNGCELDYPTSQHLRGELDAMHFSRAVTTNAFPAKPSDQEYLAFQRAGIVFTAERLLKHKAALIADPMGLGKSVEACGLINYMDIDPERVLVVAPASLRYNWARELRAWLTVAADPTPAVQGFVPPGTRGPVIISYELLLNDNWFNWITKRRWGLVIFDESQYLKNIEAKRTQRCLNPGGVADRAESVVLLSGTPIPNRAHEFYSTISTLAPDVTGGLSALQFENRYTTGFQGPCGWQTTGGRNHKELSWRLRGSGFMLRRDKRTVLPQLPPERHNIVVFPTSRATAKVIQKEHDNVPFTAEEILDAGQPLGYGALPELRHEMGLAKVPDCINWVKGQLDGGLDKIVLFGYHQDVLEQMREGLAKYKPLLVYGPTPMPSKQDAVDKFQKDPEHRVMIGAWQPLGTGWTLTAAYVVAFVESSFVPGVNEQCKDRLVRIGAKSEYISVYHLVVEGSVDASVMSSAALKQHDIKKVID